jgi:N-acetylmuramoyl-L-alanine amidase
MSYIFSSIAISLICIYSSFAFSYTVLIDPGHGGDDEGASYQIVKKINGKTFITPIYEKDLALQLSKKIYNILRKKNYNAYLTRSFDRTVDLNERAEMAEKLKADLFVSIHVNSSFSRRSKGFETYYLDNHKDAVVRKVEEVENRNLKGEELIIQQIITDLIVEKTTKSSKKLARYIHKSLQGFIVKKFKVKDRGVKPGLFFVLALAKRPAVLLEVGFLSNPKEVNKLMDHKFQSAYAISVVKGIERYAKEAIKSGPALF